MEPNFNYTSIRLNIIDNTLKLKDNQKQVKKLTTSQRQLIIDIFNNPTGLNKKKQQKIIKLNQKLNDLVNVDPKSHKRRYNPFATLIHYFQNKFGHRITSSHFPVMLGGYKPPVASQKKDESEEGSSTESEQPDQKPKKEESVSSDTKSSSDSSSSSSSDETPPPPEKPVKKEPVKDEPVKKEPVKVNRELARDYEDADIELARKLDRDLNGNDGSFEDFASFEDLAPVRRASEAADPAYAEALRQSLLAELKKPRYDGLGLEHYPQYKDDKAIVREFVRHNKNNFEYASDALRKNINFITEIYRLNENHAIILHCSLLSIEARQKIDEYYLPERWVVVEEPIVLPAEIYNEMKTEFLNDLKNKVKTADDVDDLTPQFQQDADFLLKVALISGDRLVANYLKDDEKRLKAYKDFDAQYVPSLAPKIEAPIETEVPKIRSKAALLFELSNIKNGITEFDPAEHGLDLYPQVKNDPEVMMAYVKIDPDHLQHSDLRKDLTFIKKIISEVGIDSTKHADLTQEENKEALLHMLTFISSKKTPGTIQFDEKLYGLDKQDEYLREDPEVVAAYVKIDSRHLQYAQLTEAQQKEVLLEVLSQIKEESGLSTRDREKISGTIEFNENSHGLNLQKEFLKNDPEIVIAYIKIAPKQLEHAAPSLRSNVAFIKTLIGMRGPAVLNYSILSHGEKKALEIELRAPATVAKPPEAPKYLDKTALLAQLKSFENKSLPFNPAEHGLNLQDPNLQEDPEVVTAYVKINPEQLAYSELRKNLLFLKNLVETQGAPGIKKAELSDTDKRALRAHMLAFFAPKPAVATPPVLTEADREEKKKELLALLAQIKSGNAIGDIKEVGETITFNPSKHGLDKQADFLKKDPEVIKAYVRIHPEQLKHSPLNTDVDFVKSLIEINPAVIQYSGISDDVKKALNREIRAKIIQGK